MARNTALQAAAQVGQVPVMHLLLERGAKINLRAQDPTGCCTALQSASENYQPETVRMLLENGADTNKQGGYHGNALAAASWFRGWNRKGRTNVENMLLESGADVNAIGGQYGTALQAASDSRNLVLENGADVNLQDGRYGTAIQTALRGQFPDDLPRNAQQTKIAQLLIKHGANTEILMTTEMARLNIIMDSCEPCIANESSSDML